MHPHAKRLHKSLARAVHEMQITPHLYDVLQVFLRSRDLCPEMLVDPYSDRAQFFPPVLHSALILSDRGLLDALLSAPLSVQEWSRIIERPYKGQRPLELAVKSHCIHCTKSILALGANPNNAWEGEGPPLRFAVEHCSMEMCLLLLEHGAMPLFLPEALNQPEALVRMSPYRFMQSRLHPPTDPQEQIEKYRALIEEMEQNYVEFEGSSGTED